MRPSGGSTPGPAALAKSHNANYSFIVNPTDGDPPMNETMKLAFYFLVGGLVVTLTAYYGTKGNGLAAAFITQFPSMTVLAFYLIYRNGGNDAVLNYASGFLYTVPAWVLYVMIVYFFCGRLGAFWSLAMGVGVYMGASFLFSLLKA
jgi:uncharacterized membrane protein (GlpM family)